jgi:hypothetical protein
VLRRLDAAAELVELLADAAELADLRRLAADELVLVGEPLLERRDPLLQIVGPASRLLLLGRGRRRLGGGGRRGRLGGGGVSVSYGRRLGLRARRAASLRRRSRTRWCSRAVSLPRLLGDERLELPVCLLDELLDDPDRAEPEAALLVDHALVDRLVQLASSRARFVKYCSRITTTTSASSWNAGLCASAEIRAATCGSSCGVCAV